MTTGDTRSLIHTVAGAALAVLVALVLAVWAIVGALDARYVQRVELNPQLAEITRRLDRIERAIDRVHQGGESR